MTSSSTPRHGSHHNSYECIICGEPGKPAADAVLCEDCIVIAEDSDTELSDDDQTPRCRDCNYPGLPQPDLRDRIFCFLCAIAERHWIDTGSILGDYFYLQENNLKDPRMSTPVKSMQGQTLLSSPLTALMLQGATQKSTDTIVSSPMGQEQLKHKAKNSITDRSSQLADFAGRRYQTKPKFERKRKLEEEVEEDDDVTVCAGSEKSDDDETVYADSEASQKESGDEISSDPKPRILQQKLDLENQGQDMLKFRESSWRKTSRIPATATTSLLKKQEIDTSVEKDDPESKSQDNAENEADFDLSDWDPQDFDAFSMVGYNALDHGFDL